MPEFVFSDEMIERAARQLDRAYDRHEMTLQEVARDVLTAAFEGVPATNYGIGLALQFFDLLVCVKDNPSLPRAGVYRTNGPHSFDALGHTLDVSWGEKPTRYIKRISVGQLDAPGQEDVPNAFAPSEDHPS